MNSPPGTSPPPRSGQAGGSRLIPTRANGQPAFGVYLQDPQAGISHAAGLIVLTLADGKVSAMTGFDTSTLPPFGLPRTLPS